MGRKSITLRIRAAKAAETRAEILHTWSHEWRDEHVKLVDNLKHAIDSNDMTEVIIALGQLHNLTEKKHTALHNIFDELLGSSD